MRKLVCLFLIAVSTFGFCQEKVPEPLICLIPLSTTIQITGEFPNPKSALLLPDGVAHNAKILFTDGYNLVSDRNERTVLDGWFRDRKLYNGFLFTYFESQDLVIKDIYVNGAYLCSLSETFIDSKDYNTWNFGDPDQIIISDLVIEFGEPVIPYTIEIPVE